MDVGDRGAVPTASFESFCGLMQSTCERINTFSSGVESEHGVLQGDNNSESLPEKDYDSCPF